MTMQNEMLRDLHHSIQETMETVTTLIDTQEGRGLIAQELHQMYALCMQLNSCNQEIYKKTRMELIEYAESMNAVPMRSLGTIRLVHDTKTI